MKTITKETKQIVEKQMKRNNVSLGIIGAQSYARTIKKISGINIFHKTRRRENVYMRSIFNHALFNSYGWGLTRIANFYKDNGYNGYDHTTVWHSLSMFDLYVRYEPSLLEIYQTICESQNDRKGYLSSIYNKMHDLSKNELAKVNWLVNRYYKNE